MPAKFRFASLTGFSGEPEHVLWCSLAEDDAPGRVIQFWNHKPTQDEVLDRIKFALRCFDLYHTSLSKPYYRAEVHFIEGLDLEPEADD